MHGPDLPPIERTVDVGMLTRVEGEGSLHLEIADGAVVSARLAIFEAPRYFEKLVCGRSPDEVLDIVARICGICPVAYQVSAAGAFEDRFGITLDPQVAALRRLLYCGEWIESHALHVYLLHAPDFLGYPSAVELARDHRALVERGLALKQVGNRIIAMLGGRAIHPVSMRVGGFSAVPRAGRLGELRHDLDHAIEWSQATLDWVCDFDAPTFERDMLLVALDDPDEYAICGGRITSTAGHDLACGAWRDGFEEIQIEGTNAYHARTLDGAPYLCGPSARVALHPATLHPLAREALERSGAADLILRNPYWSIAARAVELIHAAATAADLVDSYRMPDRPAEPWEPDAGIAAWSSEAPRGLLFHRYEVDDDGLVAGAQIVPPTSQNQGSIEDDLRRFVPGVLHLDDAALTHGIEQLVRSYDPCISCATHFLDVDLVRDGESG